MRKSGAERRSDALAQPTRARLFGLLAGSARAMGTDELAQELGLHPSGVRIHLGRLREAGLVVRERSAPTRGRPRACWRVASDAAPGAEPPDAYRVLARWLARCIEPTPDGLRAVQRTGRELGHELLIGMGRPAPEGPGRPEQEARASIAMGRALSALGFAPQRERPRPGQVLFRLRNCPYREAVQENAAVVCTLHRGLTEGMLDVLDAGAELATFVARDPATAGCLLEVTGLADGQRVHDDGGDDF